MDTDSPESSKLSDSSRFGVAPPRKHIRDAISSVSVPQRRALGRRCIVIREDFMRETRNIGWFTQLVRAVGDGYRALCVRSHRDARNIEHRRLFLDSTRVGDDYSSSTHQRREIQIAERIKGD